MHPTVIIRVALPKNNLAKPQHIGGACVKWIPPNPNSFHGQSGNADCGLYRFPDKDFGGVTGRGWPTKAYPLPAAFPKSLSEKRSRSCET